RRPTIATFAPSRANSSAVASPMPDVAPLIHATRPASRPVPCCLGFFVLMANSARADPRPFFLEGRLRENIRVHHAARFPAEREVNHPLAGCAADVAEQLM